MAFDLFSSKKSTTQNTTNVYDQSANAGGDNSVAVGTGASLMSASGGGIVTGSGPVSIQTSDPETVARSLAYANASDREQTTRYLATLNTLKSNQELASQNLETTQAAAQRVIDTTGSLTSGLVTQIAESKKDPNNLTLETVAKYAAYAAVAVVVLFGGFYLIKSSKK